MYTKNYVLQVRNNNSNNSLKSLCMLFVTWHFRHFSYLPPATFPKDRCSYYLLHITVRKLSSWKCKWLAQGDTSNDWHSHVFTPRVFPSSILGCFEEDIDKVLVRTTLKARMGKPDKAMRNYQNLIEYHFNIFMMYKVLSDRKNMKKYRILSYSKILELGERYLKYEEPKKFKIQTGNVAAWVGYE